MNEPELPPGAHPVTSRWARGALTFGPVGRIAATLLLLAPVWWFMTSIVGIFGLVIWCGWILPRALRDVWRPARVRPGRSPAVPKRRRWS